MCFCHSKKRRQIRNNSFAKPSMIFRTANRLVWHYHSTRSVGWSFDLAARPVTTRDSRSNLLFLFLLSWISFNPVMSVVRPHIGWLWQVIWPSGATARTDFQGNLDRTCNTPHGGRSDSGLDWLSNQSRSGHKLVGKSKAYELHRLPRPQTLSSLVEKPFTQLDYHF